jgi:DNA repair exonuclease SbcCD ATPase subunit
MQRKIKEYRNKLEQQKGKRAQIESSINSVNSDLRLLKRRKRNIEKAQTIIQIVAQKTQEELEYHISELVSLALSSIFTKPYELKIDFVIKRGKTEAEIWFMKNKELINPMMASGGGAVDVAAFALRIALWNLSRPRPNNTIILDEPFRFLSKELQPKATKMLQMLSEKLNLQFIIVTHNAELIDGADIIYETEMINGRTKINKVK